MEESFADLFKAQENKKIEKIAPGQKVTATIVGMSPEALFLDVGGKNEGVMNSSEIVDKEGNLPVQIGDTVEVYFLQSKGGEKIFTTRIGSGSDISHLEEAWRSSIPVEGVVKAEIKGGYEVMLGNKRAFCPFSQISLRRVEDPATMIGKTISVLISRIEEGGRNIVVSGRALEEMERVEKREKLKTSLVEGATVEGEISSIRDFGAFVDLGGVDGLIPISEIGWSRVERVDEHFSIGQQVKVVIKAIDWDKDRISLSYKETLQNPWDTAVQEFSEGSIHNGTVIRLAPFGAFVSLAEGVDGLIHISKLGAGRRINHPREVVEEGQVLEVRVDGIDHDARRISLAPSDHVSEENEVENERAQFQAFKQKKAEAPSMGHLGKLLQAKMSEKNKK